ncbi:MAG: septation protein IspZ [Gammaproteobacteria bacterium]|nr:septation protein IspZ [Gammaproteobacteria bacterium]
MKQFGHFLPVVAFVAVFYLADIYYATAALMAAVTVQVAVVWWLKRKVEHQLKITFWIALTLGGLTLTLQDQTFIQWKPTVVYWIFAVAFVGSQYIGERNLLQRVLGGQLKLPARIWRNLNFGWALGFLLAGMLNIWVAYNFSITVWVNFKLIGGLGLTLFYVLLTFGYLVWGGHLKEEDLVAKPPDDPDIVGDR